MRREKKKILLLRLSSMGDVALVVPVIEQLRVQHPDVAFTVLSRGAFQAIFEATGLRFIEADLYGRHKGLRGLYRLYKELKPEGFDTVVDLHAVLRTYLIGAFFQLGGTPVLRIHKGRADKARLTRRKNKRLQPLESTVQRYAVVFASLGLELTLEGRLQNFLGFSKDPMDAIGIAPFAAHREKTYPPERMKKLIEAYLAHSKNALYLFGGDAELGALDEMAALSPRIENAARLSLRRQLELMARLRVMLSMDSSNMHLASLVGTPVVSLWFATHPYAGFLGYGQREADALQRLDLACRPCSVSGRKKCWRGDWACQALDEQLILKKLLSF